MELERTLEIERIQHEKEISAMQEELRRAREADDTKAAWCRAT